MRIPIQISAISLNSDHPYSDLIYVLCNDGTIWFTTVKCDKSSDYYWTKVKSIPQEEPQVI